MKLKFLLIFLLFSCFTFTQNEFITVWKPSNGSSNIANNTQSTSSQVWFPGRGTNFLVIGAEVEL